GAASEHSHFAAYRSLDDHECRPAGRRHPHHDPWSGAGANTALRDARLLCKQLVAARDGQLDLLTAIHGYEEKMQKYGAEAVKQSLAQMDPNAPINKPVIGTAIMATQRTMLRAINHLPPAKRAVAHAFSRGRGVDRQED